VPISRILYTKELADFLALSRISLPYILPNLLNEVQTCSKKKVQAAKAGNFYMFGIYQGWKNSPNCFTQRKLTNYRLNAHKICGLSFAIDFDGSSCIT
jgi:hypothetical protein